MPLCPAEREYYGLFTIYGVAARFFSSSARPCMWEGSEEGTSCPATESPPHEQHKIATTVMIDQNSTTILVNSLIFWINQQLRALAITTPRTLSADELQGRGVVVVVELCWPRPTHAAVDLWWLNTLQFCRSYRRDTTILSLVPAPWE